jgi:hypothetical protein
MLVVLVALVAGPPLVLLVAGPLLVLVVVELVVVRESPPQAANSERAAAITGHFMFGPPLFACVFWCAIIPSLR